MRNKAVKSQTRTAIKAYLKYTGDSTEEVKQLLHGAIRLVDKAVSKNVFHKNKSARIKSRMQRHFAKTYTASSAPTSAEATPAPTDA